MANLDDTYVKIEKIGAPRTLRYGGCAAPRDRDDTLRAPAAAPPPPAPPPRLHAAVCRPPRRRASAAPPGVARAAVAGAWTRVERCTGRRTARPADATARRGHVRRGVQSAAQNQRRHDCAQEDTAGAGGRGHPAHRHPRDLAAEGAATREHRVVRAPSHDCPASRTAFRGSPTLPARAHAPPRACLRHVVPSGVRRNRRVS